MQYVNISGYRFVHLEKPAVAEQYFRDLCSGLSIKGTILLSHEGINAALAGTSESINKLIQALESQADFRGMEFKFSTSNTIPFRRLRIRVKNEIIRMGIEGIDPTKKTGHHLPAMEFKQWLEEGRDIVVLDTRNDYEVKVGTFETAIDFNIENFRDLPDIAKKLPDDMKKKPVVMFCTGGIRCEKAATLFMEYGFEDVYQLDGGIINYFEECGGAHWKGECFVFDNRIALKTDLSPTDKHYCLACLEQLTDEEIKSDQYAYNHYCPHCVNGDVFPLNNRRTESE